ncbi:MAG: hypothetical protein WKG00_19420 [Polyangiaceae bacterium]
MRSRLAACSLLLSVAAGCGGGTREAKVVTGASFQGAAKQAMKSGGVVFAPYLVPLEGADASPRYLPCIEAVNKAVFEVLRPQVMVVEGSPERSPRTHQPHWSRGLSGPRVAVHIESFRCGDVVGTSTYTRVQPLREEDVKKGSLRGEVVLSVHDRESGNKVISVLGTATEADGTNAVRAAARAASNELLGIED